MLGTKLFTALTLMGLGATVVAIRVALPSRAPTHAAKHVAATAPPAITLPTVEVTATTSRVVELEPVTVYARVPRPRAVNHAAPAAATMLVPCSDWRALGPVGRGVQNLCVVAAP